MSNNKPIQDPTPDIHPDTIPVPGEAGLKAIELLDKHRNFVMLTAVALTVLICGGLVLRELNRQKRSESAQAFSVAAGERSIEKLDAVVSTYPGTIPAGNALLTKAEVLLNQEKFDDAKTTLLTFIEKYGDHPRHAQGLYVLGNLHHNSDDLEKAAEYYDRALKADTTADIGPLVTIRQGDIALAQADALRKEGKAAEADAKLAEAKQRYEDSITRPEFRASPFIEIAESRLSLAEVGDVPVVPAPPKPEPKVEIPAPPAVPAPGTPEAPTPAPSIQDSTEAPKPATPAPVAPEAPKPMTPAPAPATPEAPKPTSPAPATPDAPKPAAPPAPAASETPRSTSPAPAAPEAPKPDAPAPSAPEAPKPTTPEAEKPAETQPTPAATPAPAN